MEDVEEQITEASSLMADEPQVALALAMPLAEAGYSDAQFIVGFLFASSANRQPPGLRGEELDHWLASVSRAQWEEWGREDQPQAFYWYVQAAEQGNPEAVFLAKSLAEHLQCGTLPWTETTGRRRELLDLAEQYGMFMLGFLPEEVNGLSRKEYLRKYMGKA